MPDDPRRDGTMGCEEALEKLATFLDGELNPDESAQVRSHLEKCRSCFSRAEFERRLKERIRDGLRANVIPPEFEDRMRELLSSLPEEGR